MFWLRAWSPYGLINGSNQQTIVIVQSSTYRFNEGFDPNQYQIGKEQNAVDKNISSE